MVQIISGAPRPQSVTAVGPICVLTNTRLRRRADQGLVLPSLQPRLTGNLVFRVQLPARGLLARASVDEHRRPRSLIAAGRIAPTFGVGKRR